MPEPMTRQRLRRELELENVLQAEPVAPESWARFVEPRGVGLNHIFILRCRGRDWVGRKTLQRDEHTRLRLDSRLAPWMLLGPLGQLHWGDEGLVLDYRPTRQADKVAAFADALGAPDSEIYFPFPALRRNGREFVCPPGYWAFTEGLASKLDEGEAHFRHHCCTLLRSWLKPGAVIHDPACSTGTFIHQLALALPDSRCIGSDRSPSMIEAARNRYGCSVDFRLADAVDPVSVYCDVLVLRFLNAEVMTRSEAEQLLPRLVETLVPGGRLIVFGHTPVLPAMDYLASRCALTLVSRLASCSVTGQLFQFYVLTKDPR
ncbi:class I SAM-dependent methyltransferase [Pseudomonas sp. SWRI154]|uniref:class I SAM-dependent methyltransferase n=1 Tax=Pseudomonas sp. SWRI154 TaxID=2745501 RepID=UPI0016489256|nr:class I SAM-dependent methyltransferase [Pseudomonas sp. SWRI154]MBC3361836.1 class I SAM-dependent methyltransferase [Pseudomonas sp. SWRI154]